MTEFRWSGLELTQHEPVGGVCRRCLLTWPCPWYRTFLTACGSLLRYSASSRDRMNRYIQQFEDDSPALIAYRKPFRRVG